MPEYKEEGTNFIGMSYPTYPVLSPVYEVSTNLWDMIQKLQKNPDGQNNFPASMPMPTPASSSEGSTPKSLSSDMTFEGSYIYVKGELKAGVHDLLMMARLILRRLPNAADKEMLEQLEILIRDNQRIRGREESSRFFDLPLS